MKNLFPLFILIALLSCSPQHRLQRLINKHPELVKKDTISFSDTFYVQPFQFDTALYISPEKVSDTFFIEKDRVKVQIIRQNDTLFTEVNLPADTVIKEIKVPYDKIVVKKLPAYVQWIAITFLALLFIISILFFLKVIKIPETHS